MKRIRYRHRSGVCEIQVGPLAVPRATPDRCRGFLFFDRRLRAESRLLLSALRRSGWEMQAIAVTAGEKLKELDAVVPLYAELLRRGADRQSVLFALGGGSVGDAIGFVAATYLRGVEWVNVPTTLLAQVDSAIGGKTGINHPIGKNLIGAFHQPWLVLCDPALLGKLSRRDRLSGLGEIVKYALIYDSAFCRRLERDWEAIARLSPGPTGEAIACCALLKARVVEKDELDRRGLREALNFGHTFGHALEKQCGYGRLRHGEAVLWGMRAALALSSIRGHLKRGERENAERLLKAIPVPALPKGLTVEELFRNMRFDKKKVRGQTRFVLLQRRGKVILDAKAGAREIRAALREILK